MEKKTECQIAIICECCEESNVDFSCSCGIRICVNCLDEHQKENPSHSECEYAERPMKIACEKHVGEFCNLFCKNCFEPACNVCSKIEHMGHNFSYLNDQLSSQRTLMRSELQRLNREFKSTYVKLRSDVEHRIFDVPAKYSSIQLEVEQTGMALQKKVEEAVKKLKMQVEAMKMEHLDSLRENKIKIEKNIENIDLTKLDISRQMADPKQLATYQVNAYSFQHCPELMERTLPLFKRSDYDFNCLKFLGTLTPSKKTTFSKLQDETSDREGDQKVDKSFELLENERHVQKISTVYGYIFDLSLSMNQNILVCGTYRIKRSFTIRTLDSSGKEIMLIPAQHQPNYISQANDNSIFYTSESKKGIHKIINGSTETIVFDESWKQKGLACMSSDDIIVSEHDEMRGLGRLSIYSLDGEKKQVFGINGTEHDLIKPTYVCANINTDICTSDEGQQMVFVFFAAGNLKLTYNGKFDNSVFTSFSPRGLAADCMGNILIADKQNHAIHVIDSDGYFLRYILNNINFPTALAIDDRKRLLVGQYLDASIQVVEYLKN
ncbi:E3 ubiquitin-protein ligase TRIM71-like [Saccostrea echinata]|uniref:E3 ubiquitin-protein ligase TRIM71-like n=1 Tax=Saccostrea echinata TaxID=191078 RepID=UPI002A820513|nr:E3 ubiquitin-protein ligase TRIM71-like [Saccostrea echinata]